MISETKTCQNCTQAFVVDAQDFAFYEKVHVPPPTWCPECRVQRRLAFRSGRRLYKRAVEFSNTSAYSPFPPESPFRIFHEAHWWSDAWDPMEYGKSYDFSRPFFDQLRALQLAVPIPHRRVINAMNSEYCENAIDIKNCYLCFNAGSTEDSLYSESINACTQCIDTLKVEQCELSYELFNCQRCFRVFFSNHCTECYDVLFSCNLVGCSNCFGCINLRNKQYYIFNKPYTKEEYGKVLAEYNLGSASVIRELGKRVSMLADSYPVKFLHGRHNIDVSGDYLDHCKSVRASFYCRDLEQCAYCQLILFAKSYDSMDITVAGGELCYELEEAGGYDVKFSWVAFPKDILNGVSAISSIQYCMYCFGSNMNLFACIGLRNKQYCILNKQYTKEEYEALIPKIIDHMNTMPYVDGKGRMYAYGEFFPPEFSPIPYNETWAQEYFPLSEDEAGQRGFSWCNESEQSYVPTVSAVNLPDHIKDVPDSITNEVIGCMHGGGCQEQCTAAFKIIPQELAFYRKMNLPLPRLCPNCRHYARLRKRNPLKLWKRQCMCNGETSQIAQTTQTSQTYRNIATHRHGAMSCQEEFETSYASERREIVYCEVCYNQEVA